MRKELEKKIEQSIKLLRSIPTDKGDIELSYSGGKDSDVILELAKMAGVKVRVIYKNTTIDPSGTIKHCKDVGAEIVNPETTFLHLLRKKGYPSRFVRFCCSKLKEYKICDIAIQGIRKSESIKRKEMYEEPVICRLYDNSKKKTVQVFLPILNWTDEDVEEFIKERNIKCHPIYYKNGQFDVTQRLGCIGCPLAWKGKRIKEFKQYPKMVRLWIKNAQVYYDSKKDDGKKRKYDNAIDAFVATLFYKKFDDFKEATYTTYGKTDWRKYLEEYFGIDLGDIEYNTD